MSKVPIEAELPKNPIRANGKIILLSQGIKGVLDTTDKKRPTITLEDGFTFPIKYASLHNANPRIPSTGNSVQINQLFDGHIDIQMLVHFTAHNTLYSWKCADCNEAGVGNVHAMKEHLSTHDPSFADIELPDVTGAVYVVPKKEILTIMDIKEI